MINTKIIPITSGIYKFTNKIKNKVYIGQAINLRTRVQGHINDYKKDKVNTYFYKAIRKYKIENFEVEILQEGNFNQNELNEMEITFIRLFKSNNSLFGYNMTNGGGTTTGFKHSKEAKQKLREVNTGKTLSEEHKQKIKNGNLGKKMSQESIEKTRQANLGKKASEETRKKLSESHKGHKHTKEHKQKISEAGKKRKHSEETKQKMSLIKKGKLKSEDTKRKMSKSKKGKISSRKGIPSSQETKDKLSKIRKGKKQTPQHIEKVVKAKKLKKARKQIQENCCYEEYFYNDFVYQT